MDKNRKKHVKFDWTLSKLWFWHERQKTFRTVEKIKKCRAAIASKWPLQL